MINNTLLNFAVAIPAPALLLLAEAYDQYRPAVLEQQGWVMTAVAAGLALTRIALWLKGDLGQSGNRTNNEIDKTLSRILDKIQNLEGAMDRELDQTKKHVEDLGKSIQEVKETMRELKFVFKRVG